MNQLIYLICLISLVIGGLCLGIIIFHINQPINNKVINSSIIYTDLINCTNLSISQTTKCMVDYVSTFYNYTSREDTIKTLEDIKQNGGDCYDYSIIYNNLASELGYEAKLLKISNTTRAHQLTMIWDNQIKGYCIIDQLFYHCWGLE